MRVRNFSARGSTVAVADINHETVLKVAEETGGMVIHGDFGKEAAINDWATLMYPREF